MDVIEDKREKKSITIRVCDKCSITEMCKYYNITFTINLGASGETKKPYGCSIHTATDVMDNDSVEIHLR
jgi:NAD-dependent dihydropyrimidine dehydrogenase PreA subunit